jgi:hypothetical protein
MGWGKDDELVPACGKLTGAEIASIAGQIEMYWHGGTQLVSNIPVAGSYQSAADQIERSPFGVASETACLYQNGHRGAHVPTMKAKLIEGVCLAQCHRANVHGCRAQAPDTMALPTDRVQVLHNTNAFLFATIATKLGAYQRLSQRWGASNLNGLTIAKGPIALTSGEQLIQGGTKDDTQYGLFVSGQTNTNSNKR